MLVAFIGSFFGLELAKLGLGGPRRGLAEGGREGTGKEPPFGGSDLR